MTSADGYRQELRRTLVGRVGGFFSNTRWESGSTCGVCRGPATSTRCAVCAGHAVEFGDRIADRVYTLTYVRGNARPFHQSAYTVKAYKQAPPARKCAEDMALMVRTATVLHSECLFQDTGSPWDAVTFVPSARHPGREHPVAELARQVWPATPSQRLLLTPGPAVEDGTRSVRDDRFVVDDAFRHKVEDRHVLVVEDTWTRGSKSQSAALALRAAGARLITILCVARWCREDWDDHKALLTSTWSSYDPASCPVSGERCAATADL